MRNRLRFILNGREVNPMNRDAFEINFSAGDYTAEGEYLFFPNVRLEQNQLQLAGDDAQIAREWYEQGRAFQGIPILILDQETELSIFGENEACLDLSDADFSQWPDQITAPIADQRLLFARQAEALSFRWLRDQGRITPADFVRVNYIISEVPDYAKAASLALTIFQVSKSVIDNTRNTVFAVSNAGHNPLIASPAISVLQQAANFAALALELVQLGILLDRLVDSLFQPPRYYRAMRVRTLLERACQQMGLQLQTSLLNGRMAKLTLLADKEEPGRPLNRNSDDEGTPRMSFADLLRDICLLFNARAKVANGKLIIERWDNLLTPSGVVLPNLRDRNNRPLPTGTNAAELQANIFVRFTRDPADGNTYTERRYAAQLHTAQPAVLNPRFNLLKGVKEVQIPFALGKRKNNTGFLEDLFSKIFVGGLIGSGSRPSRDRIGCMMLSQDSVNVPKLAIIEDNGRMAADDASLLSAERMLRDFHQINSAAQNQQLVVKEPIEMPLTTQQLMALMRNPVAIDPEGRPIVVTENVYNPKTELYRLRIRYFSKFAPDLTDTFTT